MYPSVTSGPEHDPVHPGAGPENPEGPAICGEDGGPTAWPGDQVQAGGGESQAEHRQAIQGTDIQLTQLPSLSVCCTSYTTLSAVWRCLSQSYHTASMLHVKIQAFKKSLETIFLLHTNSPHGDETLNDLKGYLI